MPGRVEQGAERRFVLHDVPWWMYVALRDARRDRGALELTYLEGDLEFLRPSLLHAEVKKVIARLIEVWAMEHDGRSARPRGSDISL